jgi:RimJ/RimL family protein N-acetyltransferase
MTLAGGALYRSGYSAIFYLITAVGKIIVLVSSRGEIMTKEKVSLRRIEREDIPLLCNWNRNQELGFFNAFTNNKSKAEFEKIYESNLEDNSMRDFLILCGEEEQPVGFCGLKDINWIDRYGEVFVSVCEKDARAKGVAATALLLLAISAFCEMNLNRIYGKVASNNKRSKTLMEECGLTHEGVLREAHYHHDQYYDIHIYGLLKKEAGPHLNAALTKVLNHFSDGCTQESVEKIKSYVNSISAKSEIALGAS